MTKSLKKVSPQSMDVMMDNKKFYPSLHLSSKDLPAIKNWEVGKTYNINLEVKQTSMSEEMGGDMHASFEIRKIGHNSDNKADKVKNKIKKMKAYA